MWVLNVIGLFWGDVYCAILLGSEDGDGNENGKKVIGLDWQNNNYARASRFFEQFLAVVARLQRESA